MSNGLDPDLDQLLSVLIWVQTVCKGYKQTTKELGKDALFSLSFFSPSALFFLFHLNPLPAIHDRLSAFSTAYVF